MGIENVMMLWGMVAENKSGAKDKFPHLSAIACF